MMFKNDNYSNDEEEREIRSTESADVFENNEYGKEAEGKEDDFVLAPRRLHPAGMIFSFIKILKDSILGIGVGTVAFFRQSPTSALLFLLALAIILMVSSILSWFRFTYRVEAGELRIEQGVFIRKKRYISLNRIHKMDISANLIHRLMHLVKVQVDTASSGSREMELSAVRTKHAYELRQVLQHKSETDAEEDPTSLAEEKALDSNITRKMTWGRLFIAGTTSGSIGVILVALLFVYSQAGQFIPENVFNDTVLWLIQLSVFFIIGLSILFLVLIWFLGVLGTMIKYGNFSIEKRENELFVQRGLWEVKELTIPFDRVQAIQIDQSILRQPFGFVQISAVIAGGSFDSKEPFPVLFPLMKKKEVPAFLEEFVPGYEHIFQKVHPLAKKGLKYYMIKSMLFFIIAFFPVMYFFPKFSWVPLLFILLSGFSGWFKFKEAGYALFDNRIVFQRRGVWNKKTMMTYHRRIQTTEKSRHKLQQLEEIASIEISLIGSHGIGTHFQLHHVSDEAANQIGDWFSYRKRQQKHLEGYPGSTIVDK